MTGGRGGRQEGVKSRVEAEKPSTLEAGKDKNVGRVAANSIPRFEKDKICSIRYFFLSSPFNNVSLQPSSTSPLLHRRLYKLHVFRSCVCVCVCVCVCFHTLYSVSLGV